MPAPFVHTIVTAEHYDELRQVCDDGPQLPVDYSVFVERITKHNQRLRDQGGVASEVYIQPAELVAWCR